MTQTLSQLEHNGAFIERHIGPTPAQQATMLEAIGASSLESLISAIVPADIQLPGPPAVGDAATESHCQSEPYLQILDRHGLQCGDHPAGYPA